jgi:hypothetical protein
MNRTAELRWFRREPFPAPIAAWFDHAAEPPVTRTDHYLVLPGTDALGVKVRGGSTSFELKLRPGPGAPRALAPGGSGQLEEWQKWSFSRSGMSRLLPRVGLPKHRWVTVEKQRRMATTSYRADAGCTIELTALEAVGQPWSTLGFESFGPAADLVPALEEAVEKFFAAVDLPDGFRTELSCGYPKWLATL